MPFRSLPLRCSGFHLSDLELFGGPSGKSVSVDSPESGSGFGGKSAEAATGGGLALRVSRLAIGRKPPALGEILLARRGPAEGSPGMIPARLIARRAANGPATLGPMYPSEHKYRNTSKQPKTAL